MLLPLNELVKELETLQASIERLRDILLKLCPSDDPRQKSDLYRSR
jgi:hypothetical protein